MRGLSQAGHLRVWIKTPSNVSTLRSGHSTNGDAAVISALHSAGTRTTAAALQDIRGPPLPRGGSGRLGPTLDSSKLDSSVMMPSALVVLAAPCLLATLCLLLPTSTWAQQQSTLPGFSEVIDVRVVNLEVVVTDRAGNRIHGLSPEDFVLRVDGQEVPMSTESCSIPRARPVPKCS